LTSKKKKAVRVNPHSLADYLVAIQKIYHKKLMGYQEKKG